MIYICVSSAGLVARPLNWRRKHQLEKMNIWRLSQQQCWQLHRWSDVQSSWRHWKVVYTCSGGQLPGSDQNWHSDVWPLLVVCWHWSRIYSFLTKCWTCPPEVFEQSQPARELGVLTLSRLYSVSISRASTISSITEFLQYTGEVLKSYRISTVLLEGKFSVKVEINIELISIKTTIFYWLLSGIGSVKQSTLFFLYKN